MDVGGGGRVHLLVEEGASCGEEGVSTRWNGTEKRHHSVEDTILLSHTDSETRALHKLVVCLGSILSKHLGLCKRVQRFKMNIIP